MTLLDEQPTPTQISNRFDLIRRLGNGGHGTVYLAADRCLEGVEVAIKLVPTTTEAFDRTKKRVWREAQIVRKLYSPYIAQLYEFGGVEDGLFFYLVFEYVDGESISERLTDSHAKLGHQTPRTLLNIAEGLRVAHSAGIIHRNLRPSNILVTSDGSAKITDFGLASLADAQFTATKTIDTLVAPGYLAPEQLMGATATKQSDVYAWSVLAYEMYVGKPPFPEGDFYTAALQRIQGDPCTAPLDASSAPDTVKHLIRRGLSREPSQRPSAHELCDALRRGEAGNDLKIRKSRRGRIRRFRRQIFRQIRRAFATTTVFALFAILIVCNLHERTAGAWTAFLMHIEKATNLSLLPLIRCIGGRASYFTPEVAFDLVQRANDNGGARMQLTTLATLGALRSVRNEAGELPLHYAARTCALGAVDPLINDRTAEAQTDQLGQLPFQIALTKNCPFTSALGLTVPLGARDLDGKSMLRLAAEAGNFAALDTLLIRLSLEKNAVYKSQLTETDHLGETVWHVLARNSRSVDALGIVNWMQIFSESPRLRDKHLRTPAMVAIEHGRLAIFNELLSRSLTMQRRGAPPLIDITAQDSQGRTLMTYLIAFWRRNGPRADRDGLLADTEQLLQMGADPNIPDHAGRTPLWHGAAAGIGPVVTVLLNSGARCLEDQDGDTPETAALRSKFFETAAIFTKANYQSCRAHLSPLIITRLDLGPQDLARLFELGVEPTVDRWSSLGWEAP